MHRMAFGALRGVCCDTVRSRAPHTQCSDMMGMTIRGSQWYILRKRDQRIQALLLYMQIYKSQSKDSADL